MLTRFWIYCWLGCVWTTQLSAFPCYITVVKSSCWKDYALTVNVGDALTDKPIAVIQAPTGQLWARTRFDCAPKQSVHLTATYTPVIWAGEEGKQFIAKRNWFFPETIDANVLAWNISVCFPDDFSSVPTPNASAPCSCDKSAIPEPTIPS